jgi:hypothetical protein
MGGVYHVGAAGGWHCRCAADPLRNVQSPTGRMQGRINPTVVGCEGSFVMEHLAA